MKSSTSRVPVVKEDDEDEEATPSSLREVKFEEAEQTISVKNSDNAPNEPVIQQSAPAQPEAYSSQQMLERPVQMSDDERRQVHENYIKLISRPVEQPKEVPTVPCSENIDTDKLIYNNKPDTERDYRNLINNLFNKTVQPKKRATNN